MVRFERKSIIPLHMNISLFQGLGLLDFDIVWREAFNILTITLIRARSLRSADINGLSDPYVKIHLVPGVAKVGLKERISSKRKGLF